MHLKVIEPSEETLEDRDYQGYLRIEIDGKRELAVHDGESEDNTLSRNFGDIYKITGLLKKAYEAGKSGEPFTLEHIQE